MRLKFLQVFLLIIFIDQALKALVIYFFPSILTINKSSWEHLLINIFILGFLVFFQKSFPIYLIICAGFSNFLDRFFRGGVVDYILVPLFPWKFNLADLVITLGVIWFIYDKIIRYEPGNNI